MVDMTEQEVMDRTIPIASKLVPRRRIPPVGVEATVREEGQFG